MAQFKSWQGTVSTSQARHFFVGYLYRFVLYTRFSAVRNVGVDFARDTCRTLVFATRTRRLLPETIITLLTNIARSGCSEFMSFSPLLHPGGIQISEQYRVAPRHKAIRLDGKLRIKSFNDVRLQSSFYNLQIFRFTYLLDSEDLYNLFFICMYIIVQVF